MKTNENFGSYVNKDHIKYFASNDCNWVFDKRTGATAIWGRTKEDDPDYAPFPMILDMEITEICNGPGGEPCSFCYKRNSPNKGTYMPFETAKVIIDKMPWLTQIAFGVDAQGVTNPDMINIMRYARKKDIVPNVTIADVDWDMADQLSEVCGAVAVSRYDNKEICYDSIFKLVDCGIDQVNMHIMLSEETLPWVYETLQDIVDGSDKRLNGLNAIVFLSLKKKGRGKTGFTSVSQKDFTKLVNYCLKNNVPFGFDSCGCHKFFTAIEGHNIEKQVKQLSEPCESSLFSSYINVHGEFFPCSFTEGENEWKNGISVIDCDDFIKDIWFSERVVSFRDALIKNERKCPMFEI